MAADAAFICILIQLELQNCAKQISVGGTIAWNNDAIEAVQRVQSILEEFWESDLESEPESESEF